MITLRRPTIATTSGNREMLDVLTSFYDAITASRQPAGTLTYYMNAALGSNGAGAVVLEPIQGNDGTIRQRALAGSRVIGIYDITGGSVDQASFEATLSKNDQIQQTSGANLSGNNLLFLVVN